MPVRRRTKPCPFCGNYLEEKRITDFTNGVEVIVEYVHPMADCILSGYEVF